MKKLYNSIKSSQLDVNLNFNPFTWRLDYWGQTTIMAKNWSDRIQRHSFSFDSYVEILMIRITVGYNNE